MSKPDRTRRQGLGAAETLSQIRVRPLLLGAEAADRWLFALGLPTTPRWHAEISIAGDDNSAFDLNLYAEEWGFSFRHGARASWIRVTDVPFVHGRDDFDLLARTPDLLAIGTLATELEAAHGIKLHRASAEIRTNIPDATAVLHDWLVHLMPVCSDEMHTGIRCTRAKGHAGPHERAGQLRWK